MAISIENMDPEQLGALTEAERAALLADEPEQPAAPVPQPEIPQGANPAEAQPTADQVAQAAEAQQRQQMVPLGALHEERGRRQTLQEQLEQREALLNDPQFLMQQAQRLGIPLAQQQQEAPSVWDDAEAAIAYHVDQATAPLKQALAQLTAERQQEQAQMAHERSMAAAREHFGPEADQYVAYYDQNMGASNLDPYSKAAMIHGQLWANPEYRQKQIDAQAAKLAEEKVAASLAGSKKQTPVTLAGLTPATDPDALPDLESLTPDAYERLSPDKRAALRRGAM